MTGPGDTQMDADLARRLRGALSCGTEELYSVLQERRPEVLRTALKNPHLSEDHLLSLLKRRDLPEDLLKAIARLETVRKSHRLKVALAYNPMTPGSVAQTLLLQLYLFELVNLCFLPGVTPDQKLAAERVIVQRLPQVELGNKITLARRATSALVAELLKEGDGRLMEPCLNNPRLKEVAILQFLNSGRGNAETISIIARHPKWKNRPNLRLALLKNPRTPDIWFTLLLPLLPAQQARSLLSSRRLTYRQRLLIRTHLERSNRQRS